MASEPDTQPPPPLTTEDLRDELGALMDDIRGEVSSLHVKLDRVLSAITGVSNHHVGINTRISRLENHLGLSAAGNGAGGE